MRRRPFRSGKMRGERFEQNGFTILNDAYNANPEAMRRCSTCWRHAARRQVAVLGEMLELGGQSESLHRAVGEHAAGRIAGSFGRHSGHGAGDGG